MKLFKCLLIIFIQISAVSAQNNYLPGYVIVNEKDTLFGLIDFGIEKQNQQNCFFKENNSSAVRTYTPEDIFGYRYLQNGKYYISKTIEWNGVNKVVFLEYLVDGMMDLYYYVIDGQSYYFFEDENGKMFSITKNKNKIENYKVIQDFKYDGIIRYRFKELNSIARYPEKFEFNQKSMINIVSTYHNNACTSGEQCIVFQNIKPDKIGINIDYTIYSGTELLLFKFDYENQMMMIPTIPVGVDFSFSYPQFTPNLSLFADISFTKINRIIDRIDYNKDIYTYYKEFNFDLYPGAVRLGLKYNYPIQKHTPFVQIGYSYKTLMAGKIQVQKKMTYMDDTHDFDDPSDKYRKHYSGIFFGMGTKFRINNKNAISVSLAYDYFFNISYPTMAPTLSDSFSACSLRMGYVFK